MTNFRTEVVGEKKPEIYRSCRVNKSFLASNLRFLGLAMFSSLIQELPMEIFLVKAAQCQVLIFVMLDPTDL